MLIIALFSAGCTQTDSPVPAAQEQRPPEPPPRVRPPRIKPNLAAKNIEKCLYRRRVPPSALAGVYYGPTDLVADQVEESRQLEFDTPADIQMLEGPQFARAFDRLIGERDRSEEFITRLLAWAFGYTPHLLDVHSFVGVEGGSGLIAGFYNHKDKSVVVKKKGELDAEYTVLAHEFAHAAVDQAFHPRTGGSGRLVDDSSLAMKALIEGEATLVEYRFLSRLSPPKRVKKAISDHVDYKGEFKVERENGVPYAIIEDLVFPYQWGLAFVCSVYKKRGWAGVNRLHKAPPTSTAEVIFPERYLKGDRPEDPPPLGKPPKPWRLYAKGTFGAFHLKSMFEAPGDVEKRALRRALGRAASWDGGNYKLWIADDSDDESVVGVSLVEHKRHQGLLCSSMNAWYKASFFDAKHELIADRTVAYSDEYQKAIIACSGRNVRIGIAPTQELAQAVVE